MATKKKQTKKKTNKRKTTKNTKKSSPVVTERTLKKRDQGALMKSIDKYERNLTLLLENSHLEGHLFSSKLLMIALYPQLMNSTNIHHYRKFFMNLQNDEEFKELVLQSQDGFLNPKKELYHYNLYPLLHQRLMEVVRECVIGGYTKKISNSLHSIVDEAFPIGEQE